MRGAATPIDWMSKPSSIAASRQTAQIIHALLGARPTASMAASPLGRD